MRFNPRIWYSRFDGGSTELRVRRWGLDQLAVPPTIHGPVVCVKHLKLREVSIERRDVFHPSAPECTDFENVAYAACDLHMREQ